MLGDSAVFSNKVKGSGKAAIAAGGKAGGKSKPSFLAIEDDKPEKPEKTEEQLIDGALGEAKKMRDLALATIANYENATQKVKSSKFWSKAAHKDAEQGLRSLNLAADDLKKFISKPKMGLGLIKGKIMECGLAVKTATASIREMNQLANKTGSTASSSKSKSKK